MKIKLILAMLAVFANLSFSAFAQSPAQPKPAPQPHSQTSAILSPKCDEAKIKELAGDALLNITPGNWDNNLKGFNVTLDTNKMDFATLSKKMLGAGCF